MKTFSQFLQEAYLSEELPAGMSRDEFNRLPAETRRRLTGSQSGIGRQGETLRPDQTPLAVRGARRSGNASPKAWTHRNPGRLPIPNPSSTPPPSTPGESLRREAEQVARSSSRRPRLTTTNVPRSNITGTKPQPSAPTDLTPPKGTRTGLRTRLGGFAGPALNVAGAALDYKERRDSGQSRARAAGGATSSLAGWAGGARFGASLPLPPMLRPVAALGFGYLGKDVAQQVYDWAANTSRPTRQAISKATGYDEFQRRNALFKPGTGLSGMERASQTSASRQARQVAAQSGTYGASKGTAIAGTGGPTTINRQKGTITSGGRTTKLSSTQLVRDPKTGKQVVGDLAYRGGKPVYLARPSVPSRETTLSAQIGRALNIGRFSKEAESQAAKREYRTALRNTQQYQKNLGITPQKAKSLGLPGR